MKINRSSAWFYDPEARRHGAWKRARRVDAKRLRRANQEETLRQLGE